MTDNIDSRNIRIFISSTFNDMQEERNELISKVFPLLRKMAKERQVVLTEIDLRWGITEKDAQESKVVQICLEEIDRSHPFFIGILGGRYGWCPASENVEWEKVISSDYQDSIDNLKKGLSMTELEIRHGVFRKYKDLHAAFFLKELPETNIEPQQKKLRDMVAQQSDFPVHAYHHADDLAQLVINDFTNLLDELYPADTCNTWESLLKQQLSELQQKTRYYVPSIAAETAIERFIEQSDMKGLVVIGESGMGKSTILSKITMDLQEKHDVIAFFSANSSNGSTFNDMADWLCHGLESKFGFDYKNELSHISELQRAASTLQFENKLFIIIDGMNQIIPSDNAGEDLAWWPIWHENVFVIFSAPNDSEIIHSLERFRYTKIQIGKLNLDERVALSKKYLKGDFNKSLSTEQLQIIGRTNSLLDNTLVFVSFLDELRKFGDFHKLTTEMSLLSSFESVEKYFEYIVKKQDKLLAGTAYKTVLELVSVSYQGVTENELMSMSGMLRIDLSILLGINELNLTTRNGRIVFSNGYFQNAIANCFLTDVIEQSVREKIVEYCLSVIEKDEADDNTRFELLYQYFELGDYDNLYCYLAQMQTYTMYALHGKLNELGKYWNALIGINPYRYDILNIIFNEMVSEHADALWIVMNVYLTVRIQIHNLIDLSNFVMAHMRLPQAGNRLLLAQKKMLENEHEEGFEAIKYAVNHGLAVASREQGDINQAFRQYLQAVDNSTSMADAAISNIGELFLRLYERTEEKEYLNYAQDILKDVLAARISKYKTEQHSEVALAYANYSSAITHSNLSYGMELAKKSLEIFENLNGFYNIDVAIQYSNIAKNLFISKTDIHTAAQYAENALKIYRKLLGDTAEDTMEECRMLVHIYINSDENDKAWTYCQYIEPYMCNDSWRMSDYMILLRKLIAGTYKARQFDKAKEIATHVIGMQVLETSELIDFYNDLGKICHENGEYELSKQHYATAFDMAKKNSLYEKAMQTLCFYSQTCFARNEISASKEALQRMIDISHEVGLPDSLLLAYAHYNLALTIYSEGGNKENVIELIKKAIDIRQPLVDEDDKDLQEYHATLEQLSQTDKRGVEETGENSREAIADMSILLSDESNDILEMFSQGMKAFDAGRMDEAKHMLQLTKQAIEANMNVGAYAQTLRYLAYADELIYSYTQGKKGEPGDIFQMYNTSRICAQIAEKYHLASKICHDMGMFCSSTGDYQSAEICYWYKIENLLADNRMFTLETAFTLYNLFVVIGRQENEDAELNLAITSLAIYIYGLSEEKNDDLQERLIDNFMEIKNKSDDDIDEESISQWGIHMWKIKDHVSGLEHIKSERLVTLLIKNALPYFDSDKSSYAFVYLHYINSLLAQADYQTAATEMEVFSQKCKPSLDDDTLEMANQMEYIIHLALHDFNRAEAIKQNAFIDDGMTNQYMEAFTPCSYAQMSGKTEQASQLFDQVQQEEQQSESQCFDLAFYCALQKLPFEAMKWRDIWLQKVTNQDGEVIRHYIPAMNFLNDFIKED